MKESKRIVYPDILRIISIFAVVTIHIVGETWSKTDVRTTEWLTLTIYDIFSRFSVPVFVMISGMFMLNPDKQKPIKDLYSKNILRICTSFIFWSVIYLVLRIFTQNSYNGKSGFTLIKACLGDLISGEYHMWFMLMIVGLYICTPILRKVAENKKLTEYYLIIWFIFAILPTFFNSVPLINTLNNSLKRLYLPVCTYYSGYYILGCYLNTFPLKKRFKTILYVTGGMSIAINFTLTVILSYKNSKCVSDYLEYLMPTTALFSAAVFVFFKSAFENKKISTKSRFVISRLSVDSFGIYLCHLMIIKIFSFYNIGINIPAIIRVPLFSVIVFLLSLTISSILNRIPVLKKYIV